MTTASLEKRVVSQFQHPRGWLGHLAGWVMARRPSNRTRNLWTLDLLEIAPGDRVLEIGFGPGFALREAAKRAPTGWVVGVDHSEAMLSQARERNHKATLAGRVKLVLARAEDLPEEIGVFEKIFAVNVVQFWRDAPGVIAHLAARLKPGGRLAVTYQPRQRGARREDADAMATRLVGWMEAARLTDVRSARLELRPVPAVCVLGARPKGSEGGSTGRP